MDHLRELYQELILDHARSPRHFGALPKPDGVLEGYNPLCGDRIKVYIQYENGRLAAVQFEATGCAISIASGSLMCEALLGLSKSKAEQLWQRFQLLVTGKISSDQAGDLGKLAIFSGLSEFPMRVKCATMAWHTCLAAMEGETETVSVTS